MTYQDICSKMNKCGWGNHWVLCAKEIRDPHFNHQGSKFCTVGNIKRLDTYALYEQQGQAPDVSEWVGEAATLRAFEPSSGGSTNSANLRAWIYREKGLVSFVNKKGQHLVCSLSDVEHSLFSR